VVERIVESLLADPPPPVPVLGGPGIGKTTVSLAALHDARVAAKFDRRRYFVRCEPATTADALIGEIAQAIGLDLGPDLEDRVFRRLEEAPAVLVLDNAETPWEADREAAERLLTDLCGIPALALLASVRSGQRPLGPAWRETITIGSLPFDDAKQAFLAIADMKHAADPLLNKLVKALDGLPLAITLMAHLAEPEPNLSGVWSQWKRKRTQLLCRPGGKTRLSNAAVSFELSVTGPRMTPDARRLLSIAALLPDGIAHKDLDALLPNKTEEATQVLRAVGLAHDEQGRLRLLAPVREYIVKAHPPEDADQERTMEHYIRLARTLGPRVGYEGGAEAIIRLAAEFASIEAMIRLGLAATDTSKAIGAAVNLRSFWALSGFGTGGLLEEAALVARNQENFQGLANCIQSLGDIALVRSDHDVARARYEEAQPLFRQVGDLLGEANCIQRLGDIALARSDHDMARAWYEEAQSLYRKVADLLGDANCIRSLGDIALARSDHDAARARYEEAQPLFRQVGDLLGEANCIQRLGDIALRRSDHDAARARFEEALPLYRRVGDVLGEANCIQSLGDMALRRSDHDAARAQFETALKFYERLREPYSIGCAHQRLARIARNDTERRSHVETARKAWTSINRPDLVKQLDAEFPPPPPAKCRKPAPAVP
jgi:tetratricopeptide (TPR) repeat protein